MVITEPPRSPANGGRKKEDTPLSSLAGRAWVGSNEAPLDPPQTGGRKKEVPPQTAERKKECLPLVATQFPGLF
jgi:hypothetical protein